jgi:hypothetical protein
MKIGSKVVCVNDKFDHPNTNNVYQQLPVTQKEYIIRSYKNTPQGPSVLLEEIKNAKIYFDEYMGELEPRFHANRFRQIEVLDLVEEFENELEFA